MDCSLRTHHHWMTGFAMYNHHHHRRDVLCNGAIVAMHSGPCRHLLCRLGNHPDRLPLPSSVAKLLRASPKPAVWRSNPSSPSPSPATPRRPTSTSACAPTAASAAPPSSTTLPHPSRSRRTGPRRVTCGGIACASTRGARAAGAWFIGFRRNGIRLMRGGRGRWGLMRGLLTISRI